MSSWKRGREWFLDTQRTGWYNFPDKAMAKQIPTKIITCLVFIANGSKEENEAYGTLFGRRDYKKRIFEKSR